MSVCNNAIRCQIVSHSSPDYKDRESTLAQAMAIACEYYDIHHCDKWQKNYFMLWQVIENYRMQYLCNSLMQAEINHSKKTLGPQ